MPTGRWFFEPLAKAGGSGGGGGGEGGIVPVEGPGDGTTSVGPSRDVSGEASVEPF